MTERARPARALTASWLNPRVLDPGIRAEVERIRVVDTHEHLDEEAVRLTQPVNLTRFFMYYAFDEVATAGMTPEEETLFWKEGVSGEDQWQAIRRAWPLAKHSGFCRAITLSIKELYGIDDLRDDTIKPLLKAVAARNKPGVLSWIIRRKAGIECCLVNATDKGDLARRTGSPGMFLFDLAVSPFCDNKLDLAPYEKASGISAPTLKDWNRLVDWYFARWGKQVVAIKNVAAYWRVCRYDDVPEAEAAPLYEKWLVSKEAVTPAERKAVQDHLFHACIRRAQDLDLPVKIHTGYHAGHNYMDMGLFQVKDLQNLFRQYPKTRFDVFHIGYPEGSDLIALTKHYANVYANLCWAWVIDPEASLQFCRQALAALPLNKILGFGGDYGFADMVPGHARIARDGIALALSEAVKQGRLTRADAKFAARRWLRDNAMELYRIEARRSAQAAGQPSPIAD